MDILAIAESLGLAAEEPRVREILHQLGVEQPPTLNDGDTDAYVELTHLGIYMVFTDEVFFRKIKGASIGTNPLILTNVSIYCKPTSTYEAFTGSLPFGIEASDDPDAVRSKLGEPDFSDQDMNLERWTVDGVWVFVQYDGDMKSIDDLSLQVPDA